ncbi:MAG TPA: GTP-binding protein [Saprospiraceae bacterium]|nr:GTP-binding protein [Saprospiraceae bacterium]
MISKKVILTGSFGVGKTSLFEQFLYSKFSQKYLTTIGVKVDKKVIDIDGKKLSLIIWDIAGEVKQDKVPNSYFLGTSAIIYVFDVTRKSTYEELERDIDHLKKMLPSGIISIVGNKIDLVNEDFIQELKQNIPLPWDILTSAKTGENVNELFLNIGSQLLAQTT